MRRGLILAGIILSTGPGLAATKDAGTPAQPPHPVVYQTETTIPVATETGIVPMSQRDYDEYVKSMGSLPVMSNAYIFGQKIPQPKTDKQGHIHLSEPAASAPRKSEQPH